MILMGEVSFDSANRRQESKYEQRRLLRIKIAAPRFVEIVDEDSNAPAIGKQQTKLVT